jgi:uncharacterized peroxidase-related enzyme
MQSKGDNDLVAQLKRDWRAAKLSDADRAMLDYVEKLTVAPSTMTRRDLDELRRHFTDEQAFDIVMVACFFNFIDRVADALGVELDGGLKRLVATTPDGEALKEVAATARS